MVVRELSHAMSEEWAKVGHTLMFDIQCVRMDVCLHDNCHTNTKLFYTPWQRIQKLEIKVYNIHSHSLLYINVHCIVYVYTGFHITCACVCVHIHPIFNYIP